MSRTHDYWAGQDGTDYTRRNRVRWEDRVPFWQMALQVTGAKHVLDVGCNAGWNLSAIRSADPAVLCVGVDVNADALLEASANEHVAYNLAANQLTRFFSPSTFDLVVTSGVLIHIPDDELEQVMSQIATVSRKWVVAIEYASEVRQGIEYRGQHGLLWKRPYGKLYEELGLRTRVSGVAQGYDRCVYWILEK